MATEKTAGFRKGFSTDNVEHWVVKITLFKSRIETQTYLPSYVGKPQQ